MRRNERLSQISVACLAGQRFRGERGGGQLPLRSIMSSRMPEAHAQ